ncbi:efflux RND transporter periplasmic adaptor subunit [Gallaecimonas mangrovi]|uniref:efflux RND transporter periplasmic adaptor subunit n=1 Tax=Gallaecimonas mangrovi TaxID=2291597 RepID=UPI000E1FE29A|nr:efflux RND transporter periplasmic adaptor subunit [Gallaecimonas mangrovi]
MRVLLLLGLLALPALADSFTVTSQPLPDMLQLQGLVEASNSATVSAQTSGRVAEVLVDVGDKVAAGTVIVRINSLEQSQALDRALASQAAAKATATQALQDWQRTQSLIAKKLVAKSELDKAKAALDNAQAALKSATAAVATAKEQLSYTAIRAPYSGVVSARLVEPGELVQPGTPLMSGFDPATLRLHVDLPSALADKARHYQWARVADIVPLKLIFYPVADSQTATVRLRMQLPEHTALLPGQWQQVLVQVGEHQGIVIPRHYVQKQGELTLVKMQGGSWRAVRLGLMQGQQVEVLSGLAAGEVITDA